MREGDIWRYAAGENIRTEINGKSERFSGPVLVVKKFGQMYQDYMAGSVRFQFLIWKKFKLGLLSFY